jgi:hypothetical protein
MPDIVARDVFFFQMGWEGMLIVDLSAVFVVY